MRIENVVRYIAYDEKEFKTKQDCINYERETLKGNIECFDWFGKDFKSYLEISQNPPPFVVTVGKNSAHKFILDATLGHDEEDDFNLVNYMGYDDDDMLFAYMDFETAYEPIMTIDALLRIAKKIEIEKEKENGSAQV